MAKGGRSLLNNYIRHANTHNRIQEERQMWEQRDKELSREDILPGWRERTERRASPLVRGHLVSDMGSAGERYDSDPIPAEPDSHSPYYWTRQLVKAEESDPYRWGHAGYKEQHPEEFVSSDKGEQEATPPPTTKRPKKRKRDETGSPSHKRRKQKKKEKKSKRKQCTKEQSLKKRSPKKHKSRTRHRTHSSSDSTISEDS